MKKASIYIVAIYLSIIEFWLRKRMERFSSGRIED